MTLTKKGSFMETVTFLCFNRKPDSEESGFQGI